MFFRIMATFFATIGFDILFNAPKSELFFCGFVGAFGWFIYEICIQYINGDIIPVFLAIVAVTTLSRFFSINRKMPITVYLISGIISFVPGAGIYYTMYHILNGNTADAFYYGLSTIKTSGIISLGIMTVLSLPFSMFRWASIKNK